MTVLPFRVTGLATVAMKRSPVLLVFASIACERRIVTAVPDGMTTGGGGGGGTASALFCNDSDPVAPASFCGNCAFWDGRDSVACVVVEGVGCAGAGCD